MEAEKKVEELTLVRPHHWCSFCRVSGAVSQEPLTDFRGNPGYHVWQQRAWYTTRLPHQRQSFYSFNSLKKIAASLHSCLHRRKSLLAQAARAQVQSCEESWGRESDLFVLFSSWLLCLNLPCDRQGRQLPLSHQPPAPCCSAGLGASLEKRLIQGMAKNTALQQWEHESPRGSPAFC